jgi:tRNA pseudouridine55 synthase
MAPDLSACGLLLIDKPSGPTSHDIVAEVRAVLGGTKAGHLGTLDPLASGLLVILTATATKLAPFVAGDPKVYEGTIIFGFRTDSMDTEGSVIAQTACRAEKGDVARVFASLRGEIEQVPPIYSAVKVNGKPAYKYARQGRRVDRAPRSVMVYRSEMTAFRKREETAEADFVISCSPGFYVREYASRLGEELGCGGTLARLRRLASGPFNIEEASTLEALREAAFRGRAPVKPALEALQGVKRVIVDRSWLKQAENGVPLEASMIEEYQGKPVAGEFVAVIDPDGSLLGIHEVLRPDPFRSKARRMM